MLLTDAQEYDVLCLLREEGHITNEELALVKFDPNLLEITDDADSIVDVCENGDVVVHNRGPVPHTLYGFANRVLKMA